MDSYLLVKHIHVLTAVVSLLGFILRGIWMFLESPLLNAKLTKILPHINDTILLSAAIALAIMTHQYPLVVGWVTLKVLLLIVYIVAGLFALKLGKTKLQRSVAFGVALVAILSIFHLAYAKPAIALF